MCLIDWFYRVPASLGLWQKEATILLLGPQSDEKAALLSMSRDRVRFQFHNYLCLFDFSSVGFNCCDRFVRFLSNWNEILNP
ncbi:hypothetical protein SLEP1_g39826 [Rubroshorea leprosula]|uniref:Uncharacterized protein n=1 Tax=Rubroshorea leprosula TaxID=152421 RepID=A0AAV5L1X0_9ROSI|nr:hypothetical protein SLEP1_g39826 [Rubroshorea leprosula]